MKMNKKLIVATAACAALLIGSISTSLAWLLDSSEQVVNVFNTSTIGVSLDEDESVFDMVPGWTIDKDPVVTVADNSEDCYVFIKINESIGADIRLSSESNALTFSDYIDYAVADGWTPLESKLAAEATEVERAAVKGVYYREVMSADYEKSFNILGASGDDAPTYDIKNTPDDTSDDVPYAWEENMVLTKPTVTKQMMDVFDDDNNGTLSAEEQNDLPKLTFTAYACQLWKKNSAEDDAKFDPIDAWNFVKDLLPKVST